MLPTEPKPHLNRSAGQDGCLAASEDVSEVYANGCIHHGRIFPDVPVEGIVVSLMRTLQQLCECVIAEGKGENHSADCAG